MDHDSINHPSSFKQVDWARIHICNILRRDMKMLGKSQVNKQSRNGKEGVRYIRVWGTQSEKKGLVNMHSIHIHSKLLREDVHSINFQSKTFIFLWHSIIFKSIQSSTENLQSKEQFYINLAQKSVCQSTSRISLSLSLSFSPYIYGENILYININILFSSPEA